jgi:hypothetical protein
MFGDLSVDVTGKKEFCARRPVGMVVDRDPGCLIAIQQGCMQGAELGPEAVSE